ncbi:cell division protein ZapA [Flavobacteriales bacterium]|nr:cell division protein ZapA [Flavobacteriales bacterium]
MSQKNIKIKIADRVYPLTINESEEIGVDTSVKKIEENIIKLKKQYKINDSQDLLAMTCLEFATKLQNTPTKTDSITNNYTTQLDGLIDLLNEATS